METTTNTNAVTVNEAKTSESPVNEDKVRIYADQITSGIRKAQASILHLAMIVHDAHETLNKKEWKELGQRTFGSPAQLSRYLQIGKRLAVFERHQNNLPKSMTAIYRLTKLSSDQIETQIQSGAISATSTDSDVGDVIEKVLGNTSSGKLMKVVKVDPSANLVTLVVNTSPVSKKQIKQNPAVVAAALTMLKRAMEDLGQMGFSIREDTIKNLEELTIDVTAKVAA